jgi:hypothetical protein
VRSRPIFPNLFEPEAFFVGRTIGGGEIRAPGGRLLKRCVIETDGRRESGQRGMHFDETYSFDDGGTDTLHWMLSGSGGDFHAAEPTMVGKPKIELRGPTWRIRFKRLGGPLGMTLTYDATFTWVASDMVIKRTNLKLFGITVARLTAFHRRIAGSWLPKDGNPAG